MSQEPAMFQGHCDSEGRIHLDFAAQQRAYCKGRLAGQAVDVMIAPAGLLKTRLQEKGFHAMIRPWCQQGGHTYDYLKQFLLAEVFGTMEIANPITGEIVLVLREPHTSKLSRAKYSELIERTLEIAAIKAGMVLEAPHEYRERKAAEALKAKRAA